MKWIVALIGGIACGFVSRELGIDAWAGFALYALGLVVGMVFEWTEDWSR